MDLVFLTALPKTARILPFVFMDLKTASFLTELPKTARILPFVFMDLVFLTDLPKTARIVRFAVCVHGPKDRIVSYGIAKTARIVRFAVCVHGPKDRIVSYGIAKNCKNCTILPFVSMGPKDLVILTDLPKTARIVRFAVCVHEPGDYYGIAKTARIVRFAVCVHEPEDLVCLTDLPNCTDSGQISVLLCKYRQKYLPWGLVQIARFYRLCP